MRIVRQGLVAVAISLGMTGGGYLAGGGPHSALAASGRYYYVATNGSDATSCGANSNQHPFQTINRAMVCVGSDAPPPSAPDFIHIAAGTYHENVGILGNVNLMGAGVGATIIDGGHNGSVIYNPSTAADANGNCGSGSNPSFGFTVGINAVTITNGGKTNLGGGICNYRGTMTVTNSLVTQNGLTGSVASGGVGFGGGVANGDTMKLVNTPVTQNIANNGVTGEGGGGVADGYGATITLMNSPVTGNSAGAGGGILNGSPYFPAGTVTLTNSRVADNAADQQGGGIYNVNGGTLTLMNSPVGGSHLFASTNDPGAGNSAGGAGNGYGGGIYNNNSTATLTNSPVSFNLGCGDGGGIWNGNSSTMSLTNSNAIGNSTGCGSNGGGIYTDGANSPLTLKNVRIANNFANIDGGGLYDAAATEPDDTCMGLVGVSMSNTTISQNSTTINNPDNC